MIYSIMLGLTEERAVLPVNWDRDATLIEWMLL